VFAELRYDDRVVAIDADTPFGTLASRVDPKAPGSYWQLAYDQQLAGLIDTLTEAPYHGRADLPHLADEENLVMDELFPLIETLQLLGFANVSGGDIELTPLGRAHADADMLERKQIFAEAVLKHVPLAAHIRRVLDERPGHRAPATRFLRELEDHLSEEEAERVLETVINWGRHAEIFAYDYDTEILSLENF
jgi:NitT/TauT family transport system ATP-binding protein